MTPLPLPLPVCLHGELLRGDLPLLCLLKGFTSVSALFHLQGLRLKFVSPWRLRVMSLSLLASPVIFLLWAWLVLCGHQLHGLCLVCSSLSLRLGWRRWDTQNSACTDPVFSFSGPDMYLSLACCIPVLSFITSPHFCHLPAVNIPNHRHSHQSDHRSACLWLWLHKDHQEHWLLIFTMLVSASEVHLGNLQIPHCVTSVKIRTEYSYGIRISHTNVSTKICFDWTIRSNTPFFFFFFHTRIPQNILFTYPPFQHLQHNLLGQTQLKGELLCNSCAAALSSEWDQDILIWGRHNLSEVTACTKAHPTFPTVHRAQQHCSGGWCRSCRRCLPPSFLHFHVQFPFFSWEQKQK